MQRDSASVRVVEERGSTAKSQMGRIPDPFSYRVTSLSAMELASGATARCVAGFF
jgi:hypothetical protein